MRAFFPAWSVHLHCPEVSCLLEQAPQFMLPDPTHIGSFIDVKQLDTPWF